MKKMLKYQIHDSRKSLIVYSLVMIALFTISGIGATLSSSSTDYFSLQGTELSTFIFLFVMGICLYKEHWLMGMQNGIPRVEFFKSCVSLGIFFGVIGAAFNLLIAKIFYVIFGNLDNFYIGSFIEMLYSEYFDGLSGLLSIIVSLIFSFVSIVTLFLLGMLIAAIYCRIPKKTKTAFAIALPISVFVVLPILATFFPVFSEKTLFAFLRIMGLYEGAQNPLIGCLTMAVLCVIFILCSYGLLRKTEVQN